MPGVVAEYVSRTDARVADDVAGELGDYEERMQLREREAEVRALVQEIEAKQAVVGRFLANATGAAFPLDAIQYPKQIADAKARVEQLTKLSYTEAASAVASDKRVESFAVGQALANNPALDIHTNRAPHSLVLEEVVRGKQQAEQDHKTVQALPRLFEQLRNEIAEGVKGVEAGQIDSAAINYYRGLAHQYNQTVEQLQAVAPQLAGQLPQEITEEMQRSVEQSQQQEQSYSLSV